MHPVESKTKKEKNQLKNETTENVTIVTFSVGDPVYLILRVAMPRSAKMMARIQKKR